MRLHNGSNYKAIAEMVGNGRTPKQCRERYHENLAGHLSHEKATDDEIEYIVRLVERYGKKWSKIAQILGNRAPNTVKNFYNSRKKPLRNQKAQLRQASAQQHAVSRPAPLPLPSYTHSQRPLPTYGQQSLHLPALAAPQPLYAGY
jgi:Myb-like DNA-binding protein FlbD